jgi:DNA repair photolyase
MIFTGDYQPAERKFELSRRMLEVCYEAGFPVFVLTRSPLVRRDLDLLQAINRRARAVVAFSIISAPGSPTYDAVCSMENLAPPAAKRLQAMAEVAQAGIQTGICMMPILPGLCDSEDNLQAVVAQTAEHGGTFVLAAGLTLADQQRQYFFGILRQRFPDLLPQYQRLYPEGSYSPATWDWRSIALRIRDLCARYAIADRMPRPIMEGDRRTSNKRVVEVLARRIYDMEIDGASSQTIWANRKAAWAIEDLEQDVAIVYRLMGRKGLQSIENVGPQMASVVETLLTQIADVPH